ncbi:MAG: Hsp20/alpha crystallin family protein [Actinomycetota bacterium]|nr:Hsp20/alpha crystallin family protein [Actinomycetota bacterium]
MLMRFDPFRDLDRLTQNLWQSETRRVNAFPMDAYRKGSEFLVHFDVPGIDPSTIELTVEKNVLTVSAERTRHWGQEAEEVVVSERPTGRFSRQLFLGETLDAERIEASCDNGVLTLRIPVAEAAKPRKVEISSSSSGGGNGNSQAIPAQSTSS